MNTRNALIGRGSGSQEHDQIAENNRDAPRPIAESVPCESADTGEERLARQGRPEGTDNEEDTLDGRHLVGDTEPDDDRSDVDDAGRVDDGETNEAGVGARRLSPVRK